MKYQPVPPHEIMEGDCYYITHLGVPDKFYSLLAGAASADSLLLLSQRGLVHRTKEEAVSYADDLLAPGIEEVQIMSELFEEEHEPPRDCIYCSGTGEGQYEGQSCSMCRGSGIQRK